MFAMQNLSIAYYFKYYIGREESVQLFNVIGTVALILGIPLSKPLAERFGKRNVYIASSLISGLFSFCSTFLAPTTSTRLRPEYPGEIRLRARGALALDHAGRHGRLLRMEIWPARHGTGFLGGYFCPESGLGPWRRIGRLAAGAVPVCSERSANGYFAHRHQIDDIGFSGNFYMSCAISPVFLRHRP
jgi:MFS family permease